MAAGPALGDAGAMQRALADVGHHARLRDEAPVHHLPEAGAWIVLGHAEVREVLADPEAFSNKGWAPFDVSLLALDPPEHTAPRRALAPLLAPAAIPALSAAAEALADELLAAQADAERFDVMADLATPLVEGVIACLFGLEAEEGRRFAAAARGDGPEADVGLVGAQIEARRESPPLLRALADAPLTGEEALALARFLWIAGTVTTRRAIAWAVAVLDEQPDVRAQLIEDPAATPGFVEEVLRLHPPERLILRTATRDVAIGGATIPAGATVYVSFALANRDPAVFEEPDRVRLERPNRHLSFGVGPHRCPGARLARAETAAACRALLRRMPEFELLDPPAERRYWTALTTPVFVELLAAPGPAGG